MSSLEILVWIFILGVAGLVAFLSSYIVDHLLELRDARKNESEDRM